MDNSNESELEESLITEVERRFESCSHQNGICYWLDTELMPIFGYSEMEKFNKVVIKAMNTCTTLGHDPYDDFIQYPHEHNGIEGRYKLSRFACFLIAQSADSNKREVIIAQYFLARMAAVILNQNDIERLDARHQLSRGELEMSATAKRHGIGIGQYDYANFKNAGYKGMYNMSLKALEKRKGFKKSPGKVLYDKMNATELAANLFRVTQTTEHIKQNRDFGQQALERTAHEVGKKVRNMMATPPELLPLADTEIKEVKKIGNSAKRNIEKIDKKKNKPK